MSDRQTTAPTTTPITLAEAKEHMYVSASSTYDDALISRLVSAATVTCENITNRAFITQTRELKMRTFYDPLYSHECETKWGTYGYAIYLPRSPLSSTSTPAVNYTDSQGNSTAASSTSFIVSYDQPGRLYEAYNNTWPDTRNVADDVTISYVCGYGTTQSDVPEPVRQAVAMVAADFYRNREAMMSPEAERVVYALLSDEMVPDYG